MGFETKGGIEAVVDAARRFLFHPTGKSQGLVKLDFKKCVESGLV